jgi:chitinase
MLQIGAERIARSQNRQIVSDDTMEDEGFVDDDFIEETARGFVARYGFDSLSVLRERAAIAAAAGDYLLAETWREIVDAAESMIGWSTGLTQ